MKWNRKGWLLFWAVAFGVPLGYLFMNYLSYMSFRGDPPAPFPIPTTASAHNGDETVFAWMQREGPCLYLFPRDGHSKGPSIMPIWPDGFHATTGPRSFLLFSEPNEAEAAVAPSELMELHGEYVKTPPADAVIPPECANYPLFLVGRVINRS
jgi:hypothetical protein